MAPPINPDFPLPGLRSIDELMGIAVAMEREAAVGYEHLARRVAVAGQADMADLFRQLAQLERDHERGLTAWVEREGRPPPVPPQLAWRLPETLADEAEDRPLDPYLALAIAVRNEERAFAFYAYLSAMAADLPEVSARAEALAREELRHIALLRGLRRRAFHARGGTRQRRWEFGGLEEFRQMAAGLEAGAALTPALRDAQEVLDTYLTIAENSPDPAVVDEAQHLAERAISRLALLRGKVKP